MDRFQEKPSFPLELDNDGNVAMNALVAHTTHFTDDAVILALRFASSLEELEAGAFQTLQLGLSLTQVKGLMEQLRTAEMVLRNSQSQGGVLQ